MTPRARAWWCFVAGLGVTLYMRAHLYRFWSWVHQRTSDRRWDKVQLNMYTSLRQIATWMGSFKWKADSWRELFDAVCTPQKVQAVGSDSPHGNDCDEAARYVSCSIEHARVTGLLDPEGVHRAWFLTVTWMEEDGTTGGHNVALVEFFGENGVIQYAYMDYGMPHRRYATAHDVALEVVRDYAGWRTNGSARQQASLLAWFKADPWSLAPAESRWNTKWEAV